MAIKMKKMMVLGAMVVCLALLLYAMPEQKMQGPNQDVVAHVNDKVS